MDSNRSFQVKTEIDDGFGYEEEGEGKA